MDQEETFYVEQMAGILKAVGTEKFEYKLAWMERLLLKMSQRKADGISTVIGGDFNVIPEDVDCHRPASWI